MHGDVGVHSTPGEGSTFWITATLAPAATRGDSPASTALNGLRALVVEDLPEALQSLNDRLLTFGLRVDALTSGDDAIGRVKREHAAGDRFDVLLIDWKMPPPDGIATLMQIRTILGEATPPSILITAHDEAEMWRQAKAAQYDSVLVKPITASALQDAMARVLRRPGIRVIAQTDEAQIEATLRERHAGQRILLAEDNPVNRVVATELLGAAGLVIESAADGATAVEMALTGNYDLVLMDVQMPKLDGLAATRLIRERSGKALPIVAMTANAFGEDQVACLEAGMNDHIGKPVSPTVLFSTLLRWLPPRVAGPMLQG
jgi:CheY-like chemotaxis protein